MSRTHHAATDPNTYDPQQFDAETRRLLRATVDWFEGQFKKRLLTTTGGAVARRSVEFVKREKLFTTLLTPSEFADGNPDKRWDAPRAALAEILGFYGVFGRRRYRRERRLRLLCRRQTARGLPPDLQRRACRYT